MARLYIPRLTNIIGVVLDEQELVWDSVGKTLRVGDGLTDGGVAVGMNKYTINGNDAVDFNFAITAEGLGGAQAVHYHAISDVEGLQTALDNKAPSDHTHVMVSGIAISSTVLTGEVSFVAGSNVVLEKTGNQITISVDPQIAGTAVAVENLATTSGNPVKTFIGTQAEWDAFTKNPTTDYLVYIVGEE